MKKRQKGHLTNKTSSKIKFKTDIFKSSSSTLRENSIFLKPLDPIMVALIALISIAGSVAIFTTTYVKQEGVSPLFWNQILFYIIGTIIFIFISNVDLKHLKKWEFILFCFFLNIVLLIWVLIFGAEINGAKRWIAIGGFTLQPSEFAKITIILTTSFLLSYKFKRNVGKIYNIYEQKHDTGLLKIFFRNNLQKIILISTSFFCLFISITLVFQQNSLGNSLLISAIYTLMLLSLIKLTKTVFIYFITLVLGLVFSIAIFQPEIITLNINLDLKILILTLISIFIAILIKFLKGNLFIFLGLLLTGLSITPFLTISYDYLLLDYQKTRIESYLSNDNDQNLSINWNKEQSKTAVGAGQIFGRGLMKGTQVNSGLLPFPETDFIFASIAEQTGFIGGSFIIFLFYILIIRILSYSRNSGTFGRLICVGVASMIILNVFQNIGMNIGILPITGVPLPLISYGGSSVLATFIGLGLTQIVYAKAQRNAKKVVKVEV